MPVYVWKSGFADGEIEIPEDLNCVPDSETERYTFWDIGVACSVEPYSQMGKKMENLKGAWVQHCQVKSKSEGEWLEELVSDWHWIHEINNSSG